MKHPLLREASSDLLGGTLPTAEQISTLDTIRDVQRLRLEPGDTLVVLCNQPVGMSGKQNIRLLLKEKFPLNQVLVVEHGLDLAVLGANE